jgi:hypothetical protein
MQASYRRMVGRHSTPSRCQWVKEAAGLGVVLMVVMAATGSRADVVVQARESPDEVASASTPAAVPESRITITANVPFDKAAAVANRYQLATHAKGTLAGFISYDGVLSLGKIKLAISDEDKYPIRIEALFTLQGTLAGSAMNEAGQASIDLAIRVEENWCPIIEFGTVAVAFDNAPRAAALAPAIPNLSDFVATQFLSSQLRSWATCDNIKEAINQFWHPLAFVIDTNAKNFLSIDPRSFALSNFSVGGKNLKFVAAITAVASVGSKQINTAVKSLPRLVPLPAPEPPGDLGVSVTLNLATP